MFQLTIQLPRDNLMDLLVAMLAILTDYLLMVLEECCQAMDLVFWGLDY
jgi:hypothetical protein